MADPLQVLSSLETLADHYTVFEPDQVLTHGQLNSVSDFWGDQVRLSRVALSGVGLVSGLHVSREGTGVRVTRGFGVSTDGDLMVLAADTLYDRFRPYDTTAPVYRLFYRGTAADGSPTDMITLQELVPVGESDVLAQPLSALPAPLTDRAVLMLMESVVNDPDMCSGTDCDNLGRDALHRVRLLLIRRSDAQSLLDRLPLRPASEAAQALPSVAMRRPALGRDIVNTALLAARYRDSARGSRAATASSRTWSTSGTRCARRCWPTMPCRCRTWPPFPSTCCSARRPHRASSAPASTHRRSMPPRASARRMRAFMRGSSMR
jgi:hypothetical protein